MGENEYSSNPPVVDDVELPRSRLEAAINEEGERGGTVEENRRGRGREKGKTEKEKKIFN